ncbi:N2,N2-dimethylguanosine tRNA methyltransferase [Cyanobium sp. FACHB-13342]|uniref:N2,N2-dimethylguanosine tRNA methyltransferase n=1 Tax=Cyanobium sp. FACHB-13342 TaxID=2692793 RepID=UPI001F54B465|nr:N2,N2-dimethylguanosine tRNA methyltransferase [Cyanobium sp. FACHB-13342]
MQPGSGFFRAESRPSRDLGVLLARSLAARGRLRVLDAMAGCGIRALRYGLEAGAEAVWANDADPDRLPLLQRHLAGLPGVRCTARTAQHLLADCLQRQERFDLVDLDGFGCPTGLVPLALEAVAFGGVLYLASTDGRSPTGHDRPAAVRLLGAAARAHPASWELALRLQLGSVARAAWALGRGVEPLVSFSEGRTFRTAVRLQRRPSPRQEEQLGMVAHCHGCGHQQVQPLIRLRQWQPCGCCVPTSSAADQPPPLAISGPLWIGPLQDGALLAELAAQAPAASLSPEGARLLARLAADPGLPVCCWPTAEIARRLGGGPPPLAKLLAALRAEGWVAWPSGVMPGQFRSDAPWPEILQIASRLGAMASGTAK